MPETPYLVVGAVFVVVVAMATILVFVPLLRRSKQNALDQAENQLVTGSKLSVIHTLVNSTLTAALQSALDATRREEALMRELVALRGDDDPDAALALEATQQRIAELSAVLDDRHRRTRVADREIATERDRAIGDATPPADGT